MCVYRAKGLRQPNILDVIATKGYTTARALADPEIRGRTYYMCQVHYMLTIQRHKLPVFQIVLNTLLTKAVVTLGNNAVLLSIRAHRALDFLF